MDGYTRFEFSSGGTRKDVYTKGAGPGILIMHELPGMVRQCVELADHIAGQGYTVFLPLLFGAPNVPFTSARTALYFSQICIQREILLFARDKDSPITAWLCDLARDIHRRCPDGRGIGVIGMCLTGGFTINLMVEDVVLAPVACQPGLPLGAFAAPPDALGVTRETLRAAVAASATKPLLCYRFKGDKKSPPERFQRLQGEFGSGFEGHELPGHDHSVLTISFVNEPTHPTYQARERIVQFFRSRL